MDMPPQAMPSAESPATQAWRTLGRHQVGAVTATAVDFATMILCVQWLGWSPVKGTAVGATLGAVTSFALGRAWVFRRHSGLIAAQGARYGLVSAASAWLNALGEHWMHDRAHVQYVLARVVVSIGVSLLWNFPMQRQFVFQEGRAR
jgi:putative flippase GtrA